MASPFTFNSGKNWGDTLANYPQPAGGNFQQNYGASFNTAPGSTFAPQAKEGLWSTIKNNPQLLTFALDALGGIVNPSQRGFTPGSDLARSKIASKAYQQRQGKLTEANVAGDTSSQRTKVPGGYKVVTTSFESDEDEKRTTTPQSFNP